MSPSLFPKKFSLLTFIRKKKKDTSCLKLYNLNHILSCDFCIEINTISPVTKKKCKVQLSSTNNVKVKKKEKKNKSSENSAVVLRFQARPKGWGPSLGQGVTHVGHFHVLSVAVVAA